MQSQAGAAGGKGAAGRHVAAGRKAMVCVQVWWGKGRGS